MYSEKPIIKLYEYTGGAFRMTAIIDDYETCTVERNLYEAGACSVEINYNLPNALLFQKNLFIQFGNDGFDFFVITEIKDAIGNNGKGSQKRTVTGKDARYIFKRRIIKNLNNADTWEMSGAGEAVIRALIKDQCGENAETERRLPVVNDEVSSPVGSTVSVSESFTNLYETLVTIATGAEIGWALYFDGSTLTLVCYEGNYLAGRVFFDTSFDSLSTGDFTDTSESFCNSVYVGGSGTGEERDIYLGERGETEGVLLLDENGGRLLVSKFDRLALESVAPVGLDRFEAWEDSSDLSAESDYEAEATSLLNTYGQTVTVSGAGLAKSPYVYKENYNVGDVIKIAFSGKSAETRILSVTENWGWNSYNISFSFGKPVTTLSRQLNLMLSQIQQGKKSSGTESVKWYTIPTDTEMQAGGTTYSTIGFLGGQSGASFQLYFDPDTGTGSKTYHVYVKEVSNAFTLTTSAGGSLSLSAGTYVTIIYIDENGNILKTA